MHTAFDDVSLAPMIAPTVGAAPEQTDMRAMLRKFPNSGSPNACGRPCNDNDFGSSSSHTID